MWTQIKNLNELNDFRGFPEKYAVYKDAKLIVLFNHCNVTIGDSKIQTIEFNKNIESLATQLHAMLDAYYSSIVYATVQNLIPLISENNGSCIVADITDRKRGMISYIHKGLDLYLWVRAKGTQVDIMKTDTNGRFKMLVVNPSDIAHMDYALFKSEF